MPQQQIGNRLDASLHMMRAERRPLFNICQHFFELAPRDVCSAVSQVVFCPDGTNLFVSGEFAAIRLRKRFRK